MIRALILTGDGINCEEETAYALTLAGAECTISHVNHLIANPQQLTDSQIFVLPGGFSFGDEVSSGKILAIKLRYALGEMLADYVDKGNLVLGICNGFQALVKLGILPKNQLGEQQVTLTHNRQRRFINRWVNVNASSGNLFFDGLESFDLPIRHGEGRLLISKALESQSDNALQNHIALQYDTDVNGSYQQIAGLVSDKGNVLGLMPHPEGFVRWTQHPSWTSLDSETKNATPPGLVMFQNMVKALRN